MAVTTEKYASSLALELIVGTDDKGNPKKKDKNIFKVKTNASDEDLYQIADAASKLLKYESISVKRTNKNLLLG